jgi:hypothetical protein
VKQLCCRKTNLIETDFILEFMIISLKNQDNIFSRHLLDDLIERIIERRNNYADVLWYLTNSNKSPSIHRLLNSRPLPKNLILKIIKSIADESPKDD